MVRTAEEGKRRLPRYPLRTVFLVTRHLSLLFPPSRLLARQCEGAAAEFGLGSQIPSRYSLPTPVLDARADVLEVFDIAGDNRRSVLDGMGGNQDVRIVMGAAP
jgi:hypothetical protein